MQSTNNLMSSPSSGKTSLLGKFLVTYVERLCLWFEKMQLDAMWTRSNTKRRQKTQNAQKLGGWILRFGAGFSGGPDFPVRRPDFPGWQRENWNTKKKTKDSKTHKIGGRIFRSGGRIFRWSGRIIRVAEAGRKFSGENLDNDDSTCRLDQRETQPATKT